MDSLEATRRTMECKYCLKKFSKGEHLRRHERSHTGAKPFLCKECQRSFSRQDSLARHEKLHTRRRSIKETLPTEERVDKPVTPESIDSNEPETSQTFRAAPIHDHPDASLQACAPNTSAQPVELDFDLIWPDSEDLCQTILYSESSSWQVPLGTLPFSASPSVAASESLLGTPSPFDSRPPSMGAIPFGGNHQAVQDVSKMISNLSSSVTAAADVNSISSVFLDECLHMYFLKFNPTFPILHRATFVFRECAHPLLLNAIAIGSLYLGPKDAVGKGEVLWRLAHTAMATSWQTLITHRGPYDTCDGVQLVVTAVLGQVYGALSRNRAIRSTSQAFQSLGLGWARRCGMFDSEDFQLHDTPPLEAPESQKQDQWRRWVAREIQQRAVLALYMLDGLISQMSGEPTSVRHATNPLTLPSGETAFEASTADEWISVMQFQTQQQTCSFRQILRRLFALSPGLPTNLTFSAFSYKVVLEGLHSLISDDSCDGETAVGVPSRQEVRSALGHVYESIASDTSLTSADRLETLLRWHSVCLDTIVNSSLLCRTLCSRYEIKHHIWRSDKRSRRALDLVSWVKLPAARSALLHATAIQEIVEQLPRGRAHAIHMPSSLFTAATVYSVFALAGQPSLKLPSAVVWQEVLSHHSPNEMSAYGMLSTLEAPSILTETETSRYVRGEPLYNTNATSRNLLYELNSIQKLFRCLLAQWGVAYDMESVVEQWIGLCHSC